MTFTKLALGVAAAAVAATAVFAGSHGGNPAVGARKAQMQLQAFNLGILGAMAQGKTEYNADAAKAAAGNLLALVSTNQMAYWPMGTAVGEVEGTRALPALWSDMAGVMKVAGDLNAAATALEAAAGTDLASLQGAIGAVGAACGACHEAYRAPN